MYVQRKYGKRSNHIQPRPACDQKAPGSLSPVYLPLIFVHESMAQGYILFIHFEDKFDLQIFAIECMVTY